MPPVAPVEPNCAAALAETCRTKPRAKALLCALLSPLLVFPACTGLEPAVIGAAVSGVQTGVTLFSGSRVWSYEYAHFDDVVDTTKSVTDHLELPRTNENDESEDRYWSAHRYGDSRRLIEIEIRRETDVVTSIRIDVGHRSQRGMAALILRQIFAELRASGAYPEHEAELRTLDGAIPSP